MVVFYCGQGFPNLSDSENFKYLEREKSQNTRGRGRSGDQFLLKSAFSENGSDEKLDFVEDGVGLIHYLTAIDRKTQAETYPDIIILDLNMPRKNGKEVLSEIKRHPLFKKIPDNLYDYPECCGN
jgi:CheY-like chemotaxis protein